MWQDLIVCNGPDCGFSHVILLIKALINNLIVFSTFLATAAFAYAGFVLLSSGGSEAKKDQAKKIFKKVMIGYLWILGAWLLVYTITSALLEPGFSLIVVA